MENQAAAVGELFRPLAFGVIEDLFAETEIFGGDFEVLVFGQVLEPTFKAVF